MIITNIFSSAGGGEITLEGEKGEKYTLTLADAKRLGFYEVSDDNLPIEFSNEEMLVFLSQKLRAIKYASYLLSFSDKSEATLKKKMREKDYADDVINEAVESLRKSGIINDESLCLKKYISIAKTKMYGARRVKSELFAKGFSSEDIRNAEQNANVDFYEICEKMCQKLLSSSKADLTDYGQLSKFKAKLSRYGFSFDEINTAISIFSKENLNREDFYDNEWAEEDI